MLFHLGNSIESTPNTLRGQRLARGLFARSTERLSTGLRINQASDDPAGLVGSEFLRSRVRSLEQANENLQAGANQIATAEGALGEISDLLVGLRQLTVDAANLPDFDRVEALQREAEEIIGAIDRIGATTRAGRTDLLTGAFQRQVTVLPASSMPGLGVVQATVPDFSTIPLGRHQIAFRSAGGIVTGVDTSRATTGDGEFGRVTDGIAAARPFLLAAASDRFVFSDGTDFFVQEAGGLDDPPAIVNLTAGFTNVDVASARLGSDQSSIVFEADNGAARGLFQVTFAGAVTQLGGGFDDRDFDLTRTALFPTQRIAFLGDSTFDVANAAGVDDVDGLAFATVGGVDSVFVLDSDAGAGGGPGLQRYDLLGRPLGGIVDLTPIFGAGNGANGLTFDGANLWALDGANRVVHRFTTAGAFVSSFALNTVGVGTPYAGALTIGVPGSASVLAGPTVSIPEAVDVPENLTLTFTEDTGAGITYTIVGSQSGVIVPPGTPFVSGVPITVNGIDVTFDGDRGASRSGVVGAVVLTNDINDRMDVSLDGGVTFRTLDLTAGAVAGGAAIAASIQAQLNAAFGAGQAQAVHDAGSDRIVISNLVGGTVTVQDAAGPSVGGLLNDAVTTLTDGVNDVINVSLDGAPGVDVDILAAGSVTGGPAIRAALQAALDGAFGVGATRVELDNGAGGPGTGDERFRVISDGASVGDASIVIGVAAANDAAPTLLLGVANGGTEADQAISFPMGLANGGTEGLGADILTGDTFTIDVTSAGLNAGGLTANGIAFNATTGRLNIGDARTGFIYSYTTAGVQVDGGLDFDGLAGFGNVVAIEHDPTTPTGSFFVLDTLGNVVEIDDDPAALITPSVIRSFAAPGAAGDIARHTNADFNPGRSNLFVGDDGAGQVHEFAFDAGAANYADALRNVYTQNLTTLALEQVSGEPGSDSDPHLSGNGARIAYVANGGTDLVTRDVSGGTRVVQTPAGGPILSIDSVSATGRFVAFTVAGGGRVIDMTTGAVTVTGTNQEFHPTLDQLFYFAGGEVQRLDLPGAAVTQITGIVGVPSAAGEFDLSPDASRIVYVDDGGDVQVLTLAAGTVAQITNLAAGDPLTTGTNLRFSEDSLQIILTDPFSGDAFIRNANGTLIDVLDAGIAFDVVPNALPGNSLIQETFTLTLVTDNDQGFPGAAPDEFTVVGSISGAQAVNAQAGVAYTTVGAVGGGLNFTIRNSGQYAVGTTFTIDTASAFGTSIDGGPEFITATGASEIGFTADGGAIELEFGPISAPPGVTVFQEILIEPGAVLQSGTEILRDDQLPYWIDRIDSTTLGLAGLDVADFAPRVSRTEVASTGLTLVSAAVDPLSTERTVAETLEIEFVTAGTFSVTGSVSGAIAENQAYVPGGTIQIRNVTVVLTGAAGVGDEIEIEVTSSAALVDQAIDRVSGLRGLLGATVQEAQAHGEANAAGIENLTRTESTIRDLDYAQETAEFVRHQIFLDVAVSLEAQVAAAKESIGTLVTDTVFGVSRAVSA